MTVVGYLADAAATGLPLDWERVAREAALTPDLASRAADGA